MFQQVHDFYGMIDDNKGAMVNPDKLDITVGRVQAETNKSAMKGENTEYYGHMI